MSRRRLVHARAGCIECGRKDSEPEPDSRQAWHELSWAGEVIRARRKLYAPWRWIHCDFQQMATPRRNLAGGSLLSLPTVGHVHESKPGHNLWRYQDTSELESCQIQLGLTGALSVRMRGHMPFVTILDCYTVEPSGL